MEFMARLAALVAPPRYPLIRYAGVLGPRSAWRKEVVPQPRERAPACGGAAGGAADAGRTKRRAKPSRRDARPDGAEAPKRPAQASSGFVRPPRPEGPVTAGPAGAQNGGMAGMLVPVVIALAPNILSVSHWGRLLGGLLYASTPRLNWARLLQRTFEVDVLACPGCLGRLRVLAVISERAPVLRILGHLALPTEPPSIARARDPTDEADDTELRPGQLELGLA